MTSGGLQCDAQKVVNDGAKTWECVTSFTGLHLQRSPHVAARMTSCLFFGHSLFSPLCSAIVTEAVMSEATLIQLVSTQAVCPH